MKCVCNLDYNIRMYKYTLNKYIVVLVSISFLFTLSSCGNKGNLIPPSNIISLNK